MKTITVVSIEDSHADFIPVPIQTLLRVLLNDGYAVKLIGGGLQKMSNDILAHPHYKGYELPKKKNDSILEKMKYRYSLHHFVQNTVKECMQDSDYLWTTSVNSIREVGKLALQYRHILELLELIENGYYYKHLVKFHVDKYARNAWKNIVVELNRAYIQKVWWELQATPHVIPNKPYNLNLGEITPELQAAIQKMKEEKKKIVLYLGGIYSDRNFEACAKAIQDSETYVLYIVGGTSSPAEEALLQRLIQHYSTVYLGKFAPPKHLALVQYASVGLLPYKPVKGAGTSELNALYCAPNKIWEYAGFGVPMVGSDVLGLKFPFEQWNIGRCCDFDNENAIIEAIEEVDRNHDEMSKNCYKFYDSVDLEKIVSEILEDG